MEDNMKHLDKNKAMKPNSGSDDTTRHTHEHGGRSGGHYDGPRTDDGEARPTGFVEVGTGEPTTEE